jgi:outer membrane immunogenic protein
MNKFLLSAVGLVVMAISASAADLAARPYTKAPPVAVAAAYDWSGFYIGVNAGSGSSRSNVSNTFCPGGAPSCYPGPAFGMAASAGSSGDINNSSFVGGIQAGYNWQRGALLLGVETDIDYFGINASRSVRAPYDPTDPIFGVDVNDRVKVEYLGTVRGRLGYASGTLLLYATGGLAYTTLKHSHDFSEFGFGSDTHCSGSNFCDLGGSSQSRFKTGWTVGGGAEWAFNRSWSLKAEYLYADLGGVSSTTNYLVGGPNIFGFTPGSQVRNSAVSHSADLVVQTVRVGINYRFGGPVVARY